MFGPKKSLQDICFIFETELGGHINGGILFFCFVLFFWQFYLEANSLVA